MRLNSNTILQSVLLTILLGNFSIDIAGAQTVTEPPVPVYLFYQEDSLKIAYQESLFIQEQKLNEANKQIDSLRTQLQNLESERSRYNNRTSLLALLSGIIIFILLIIIFRIRKQLSQSRRT
jgi:hypothetical protein